MRLPNDRGEYNTYEKTTSDNYFTKEWEVTQFTDISMRWEDVVHKDGNIYPEVELWAEKAGYNGQSQAGSFYEPDYLPTSLAYVHIRDIAATIYYQRRNRSVIPRLTISTGTPPLTTSEPPMSA